MSASKVTLQQISKNLILDQGEINSCAENALAATLDLVMRQAGHPIPLISRLQSYADARIAVHELNEDAGTFTEVMLNMAKTKGLAPESLWQYNTSMIYTEPPASVYSAAAQHKISSWGQVNIYQQYSGIKEEIKSVLDQGKALILSFNVRNYFFEESGPLTQQVGFGSAGSQQGHAVVIVGVDDNLNGGSYIVKNSWGEGWGDGGYGTIKYTQFNNYVTDFKAAYYINGFDGLDFTYTSARVNVAQHYAAILGRAAELSGLDFYAGANVSDEQLTGFLLNSSEGILKFGSLTNAQFVEAMYGTVLGRHSDADGLAFYTGALDSGYSRASIMNMVINAVEAPNGEESAHAYLENKTNVSSYISIAMQYAGGRDVLTHDRLAAITSDVNSMEIIKVGLPHDFGYA